MSKEKRLQSALFIGNGDDDAAVLVVGGDGGNDGIVLCEMQSVRSRI